MNLIRHACRVDVPIRSAILPLLPTSSLQQVDQSPDGAFALTLGATTFVHAYALLGRSPARFNRDLSIYLAGVNAVFDRGHGKSGYIELGAGGTTDWKRRVAEDLGVSLAALFMVASFGLTWETIAQIPAATTLKKKRPDFEGFNGSGSRYIFEAKGTTSLGSVEKALHKAIAQVKQYPEVAEGKLAIVTFLSTDERLFPSQTFVVDPPAMPDTVPPTRAVATLLHGEPLFEFASMPLTAKLYLANLAKWLRLEPGRYFAPSPALLQSFEQERSAAIVRDIEGVTYIGSSLETGTLPKNVFFGVQERRLRELLKLPADGVPSTSVDSGSEEASFFSDGSCVIFE